MTPKPLTPEQEAIRDAVLQAVLQAFIRDETLIPFLLSSREIIKIFRITATDLCRLRETGILPVARINNTYLYNPADILQLMLLGNLN